MYGIINSMKHDSYWRDIPGEPLYQAHPDGRIRSKERAITTRNKWSIHTRICPSKELTLNKSRAGYLVVSLAYNRTKKQGLVHRLIAETFIPNPENKPCVNHKDGNKLNNSIDNLEWVTYSENIKHARRLKLIDDEGHHNHNASLTKEQAKAIRSMFKNNLDITRSKLARDYKVSVTVIERLIANKTYKNCL